MSNLKKVRGTEDLSEEKLQTFQFIVNTAKDMASLFCFEEIATPIMEFTEVFSRTLGEGSDILNKEMFTFEDRGGQSLSLRPEGTAGVARHFIENKYEQLPLRFFYSGPFFRYERPQKGRLRQFHQIGVEILGEAGYKGEIECISLAWLLFQKWNMQDDIILEINSIGDLESRSKYKQALLSYLKPVKNKLSKNSQKRLKNNPLRILDSKDPEDLKIIESAPSLLEFLNPRSKTFFENVLNGLSDLNIPWKKNSHLVRGLDYYNHSVFEFKSHAPGLGSQNTLLAGGRYDSLIETIAQKGPRVHSVGWGAGIERISLAIPAFSISEKPTSIALVALGKKAEALALKLAWDLRNLNLKVLHPRSTGSLSKKMKKASQMKAKYAVIFGPEEIQGKIFSVKNLDEKTQESVQADQILSFFKSKINDLI